MSTQDDLHEVPQVSYASDFQEAIDKLDQRSLLLAMALLGKRAMDILQVHKELEK